MKTKTDEDYIGEAFVATEGSFKGHWLQVKEKHPDHLDRYFVENEFGQLLGVGGVPGLMVRAVIDEQTCMKETLLFGIRNGLMYAQDNPPLPPHLGDNPPEVIREIFQEGVRIGRKFFGGGDQAA